MPKEQQTDELKLQLYELTKIFTRALKPRYYYQYRGSVDDLASEFYCQFLTPKGRKGAVKETLLDKFDPEETSLPYLVKICVTRKLIDQSRQHPYIINSLDGLLEEKGDSLYKKIADVSESSILDDPKIRLRVVNKFRILPEDIKNKLFVELFDSDSSICEDLEPALKFVDDQIVQQVTDKTVVMYNPKLEKIVQYSLEDGHPRGKERLAYLSLADLTYIKSMGEYKSHFTRELLVEYCKHS